MTQQAQLQGRGRPRKTSRLTTLSDLGITRDQASKWMRLAEIPAEEFDAILAQPGPKLSTERILAAAGRSRPVTNRELLSRVFH